MPVSRTVTVGFPLVLPAFPLPVRTANGYYYGLAGGASPSIPVGYRQHGITTITISLLL
jgi:hypothetical protein